MPDVQDDDLQTCLNRMDAEALRPILMARESALVDPPAEQTIIPMPVFPHRWSDRVSGIVRYPCALGCGWAHDEDAYDVSEPCVFPLDAQGALDEMALNEQLAARGAALRERIETAIRDHFAAEHPGRDIPLR